jgi:hypothetical protein
MIREAIRRQVTARGVRDVVEGRARGLHLDEQVRNDFRREQREIAATAADVEAVVKLVGRCYSSGANRSSTALASAGCSAPAPPSSVVNRPALRCWSLSMRSSTEPATIKL